jgi:hypothetical protein
VAGAPQLQRLVTVTVLNVLGRLPLPRCGRQEHMNPPEHPTTAFTSLSVCQTGAWWCLHVVVSQHTPTAIGHAHAIPSLFACMLPFIVMSSAS